MVSFDSRGIAKKAIIVLFNAQFPQKVIYFTPLFLNCDVRYANIMLFVLNWSCKAIIARAISSDNLSDDRAFVPTCKMKWYGRHTGIPRLWTQVLDTELWMLDPGCWTQDAGIWTLDARLWTLVSGLWTLDAWLWVLDAIPWMLGSEHWTLSLTVSERNQSPVSDSA